MSMEEQRIIKCPYCKKEGTFTIWHSLNIQINPEMKDNVVKGTIFKYHCPFCEESFFISYDFLYHDMEKNLMIFYSEDEQSQKAMQKEWSNYKSNNTEDDIFAMVQNVSAHYVHRIVNNRNSLAEKIGLFDEGFDDRIIELMKLITMKSLSKNNNLHPDEIIYLGKDSESEKHTFGIVIDGELRFTYPLHLQLYANLAEKFMEQFDNEKSETYIINNHWAKDFLLSEKMAQEI